MKSAIRMIVLIAIATAGVAYAGAFTMTTRPIATVIVNSTVTGRMVTTTGHLGSIQYTTVNGQQIVTVTVMP